MQISFILPAYNSSKTLEKCIGSIINQRLNYTYEIIVVDDNSTDDTVFIINLIKSKYPELIKIILHNKNLRPGGARNSGLKIASGEYISFIDTDDYLFGSHFNLIIQNAKKFEAEIAYFVGRSINKNSSSEIPIWNNEFRYLTNKVYTGLDFFTLPHYTVPNGVWGQLYKKDFLIKNNIFFEENRIFEDGIFTLECLFFAKRIIHTDIDAYRYVRGNSSITTNKKDIIHLRNVLSDGIYVIEYFTKRIDQFIFLGLIKQFIKRVINRKKGYVLIIMVRMLRYEYNYSTISNYIMKLRKLKVFPFIVCKLDGVKVNLVLLLLLNLFFLFPSIFLSLNYFKCKIYKHQNSYGK